jgi:predicted DNA-binding transcriptional regulator AlpA
MEQRVGRGKRKANSLPTGKTAAEPSEPASTHDIRLSFVGIFGEQLQQEAEAEAVATALFAKLSASMPAASSPAEPPALMDAPEAARLLSISVKALYQRVSRHRVPGVVRTGEGRRQRIQFHREKLLAGLERKARS